MDDKDLDAMLGEAAKAGHGAPASALQQRVLADFDRVAARRAHSWIKVAGEWLWPGVPLWQPAAALALSLAIGIFAGTLTPFENPFDADTQLVASNALNDFDEALP